MLLHGFLTFPRRRAPMILKWFSFVSARAKGRANMTLIMADDNIYMGIRASPPFFVVVILPMFKKRNKEILIGKAQQCDPPVSLMSCTADASALGDV
jgi:hypothetical protein